MGGAAGTAVGLVWGGALVGDAAGGGAVVGGAVVGVGVAVGAGTAPLADEVAPVLSELPAAQPTIISSTKTTPPPATSTFLNFCTATTFN